MSNSVDVGPALRGVIRLKLPKELRVAGLTRPSAIARSRNAGRLISSTVTGESRQIAWP
jgi:hypothetical protein